MSDSSNDRSDHQGNICTPVSNMCLLTTICAAFKDLIFSGTPYWNVLLNELFRFIDARWRCQVDRNIQSEPEKNGDRAYLYHAIHCSGGNIRI